MHRSTILLATLLLVLVASCHVQREFVIDSVPQGAVVRLDDRVVGRTPLTVPFEHYGTRRFSFYKDGYLAQSEVQKIKPAWYASFPFDLVSDTLFAWAWRDLREIHVELEAETTRLEPIDIEGLLERAENLRRAGPKGPIRQRETPATPAVDG